MFIILAIFLRGERDGQVRGTWFSSVSIVVVANGYRKSLWFVMMLPILTGSKYVYILCFMEKKTSPITKNVLEEIERDCLCLLVRKTARMVTQWYDACLHPTGLRSTQFNSLVAIGLAQTVPLTRLADVLVLDRTTLARNLKPLERQGLVVVEPGFLPN